MVKRRSLWPREHGAYAQLAAPLVSALAIRAPSAAAGLLAFASATAFLANEPLLVALGHRGKRLLASDGRRARTRLGVLAALSVSAGAAGLGLASNTALAVAGVVAIPVAAMLVLAWRRSMHSVTGEVVAAIALPGAAAVVAAASGVAPCDAFALWATWSVGYAASVVAVHRVIARHRKPATWWDPLLAAALACVTTASLALAFWHPLWAVASPLAGIASVLAIRPPKATKLRAIGVALVIASVASLAIAIAVE